MELSGPLTFAAGDIALGAFAALTLGLLLRVRVVAVLLAAALAAALAYAAFLSPEGPGAAFELAAARLAEAARSGFLTGFALASTVAALLRSLVRQAARPGRKENRKGKRA